MSTPGLDKAYLRFAKAKEALTRAVKREIVKLAREQGIRYVLVREQGVHCESERHKGEWTQCTEIEALWDRYQKEVGEEMIYRGEWHSRDGWRAVLKYIA